jgi:steroid delta-isomerase-like uncharacterized protein
MTSKNWTTVQKQFDAFNRHDADGAASGYSPNVVFTDHSTGETLKTQAEIRDQVKLYVDAASDGRIAIRDRVETDDAIVVELTFTGTNDGPLGPLPATGRPMTIDAVNMFRFDKQGKIVAEDWYYDQLGLMAQLGHVSPPG